MTATTRATRPPHDDRRHRRLHAIEDLAARQVLLAVPMFLLLTTRIAETLGVLLVLAAIGAGSVSSFRSFRRAWTEPSHHHRAPRRVKPDVLTGPPLVPIAVDRDGITRYRNTPPGDGGRA